MSDLTLLQARQRAADLLAAAARHPRITAGAALQCLLAEDALGVPGRAIGAELTADMWGDLVTAALQMLARLPETDFDDPAVQAATRHAQHAMWGRP